MSEFIPLVDILLEIGKHFEPYGTMAEFSREHGVSDEYIRLIVRGERTIPNWMLEHFGYERIVRYRRIEKPRGKGR
jgi:hypothetical protein